MRPETIRERASQIRWKNRAIAHATGLAEMTIGRTLNERTSPNMTTLDEIERAIVGEELRLRDYLLALHPVQASGEEKAA